MNTKERPIVIYTDDGCWYQQRVDGLRRSSYLGRIGTADEVREWCECNAIEFTQKFHAFEGTAIRDAWPSAERPPVAGGPSEG